MNQASRTATGRRVRGWLTAAVLLAAGLAGAGAAGPAAAAPNQYAPSIGTATGNPVSGPVATAPLVVTSGLCPAGTTAINGFVDSAAAGLVTAVAISSNTTQIDTSSSSGINFSFNLLDIAASQGKVLINGSYQLSIVCLPDLFGTPGTAQFDATFVVSGGATPTSAGTTYTFQSAGAAATTTTISASPATQAQQGATVTLTAAVSPANAAGSVQFQDVTGGTPVNVGAAAAVSGGSASVPVSTLTVGSHTLRAVFTPTNATAFASSTSGNLSYVITVVPAPTPTGTGLTVTPAATAVLGSPVTLNASVTPAGAVGRVQFEDVVTGTPVNVGASVAVAAGAASLTVSSLAQGAHTLQARFVPTDPAAFDPSTSTTVAYTITPPVTPPTSTSTVIGASPAGSADQGAPVTLSATVSPNTAVGSVQFIDGPDGSAVNVGAPVSVSGGTALVTTSTLAVGAHSLRAVFTPTNAANFSTSTSAALAYTINQVNTGPTQTSTSIASSPQATAPEGTAVTVTATVAPAAAAGSVTFTDAFGAGSTLGTVAVAGGTASVTTSALAVGTHQVTATFTPADATLFTGSSSVALGFTVTPVDQGGATLTSTTLRAKRIGGDDARQGHREWEGNGCDHGAGAGALLEARVTPRADGTVQFVETFDGVQTPVGDPVTVRRGRAWLVVRPLGAGSHTFVAIFSPADPAAFQTSTSAPATVEITAKGDAKDDKDRAKDERKSEDGARRNG